MIWTPYTITNSNGDQIILNDHTTDPNNVIALQSYPRFDLEIRNNNIAKEGQHGVWQFNSYYGGRTITFEGTIVAEDEEAVLEIRDQLNKVTRLPAQPTLTNNGNVTITFTDPASRPLQFTARLTSSIQFDRRIRNKQRLNFQMTFISTDLVFESQTLTEDDGVRGYIIGNARLATLMPFDFPPLNVGSLTVNNGGSADAYLTARLYGGADMTITNPKIRNITNGQYMQVNVTLSGASEYIEINSKLGTVVDQNGADKSGYIQTGSSFIRLFSGDNELLYTSEENENSSSPLETRVEPTEIFEIEFREAILI